MKSFLTQITTKYRLWLLNSYRIVKCQNKLETLTLDFFQYSNPEMHRSNTIFEYKLAEVVHTQ